MIISIYIYIIHVYARFALGFYPNAASPVPREKKKHPPLRASPVLPVQSRPHPAFLPPSLPPTRGELVSPPYIAIFVLFHVETSIYNKLY